MNPEYDKTATRGHVFVIAAPSGTGKTTVCRKLLERDPRLRLSVSHTTRKPRSGEIDGVDYYFVTEDEFDRLVELDGFLEHAKYVENIYGTSWKAIEGPLGVGHDVVLEIEVQGATQIRQRMPSACLVFLLPPSLEVLKERLEGRGTDNDSVVARRLALVDSELAAAKIFDYAVINEDLEHAVTDVLKLIVAVRDGRDAEMVSRYGSAEVLERWSRTNSS